MKFIDIHNHAIPYWDDGAKDWDMALAMLREAWQDGIEELVCTPHVLSNKDLEQEEKILELFEELVVRVRKDGIGIKLHVGAELYIQPDMKLERRITTLGQNGRYYLVEFSMSMIPSFVTQKFFDLILDDKIPVIAHPERYVTIMEDPKKAYDFVERGALLQVNAGSLLGVFGTRVQNTARHLMEANLVHFVATDGHDLDKRPLRLSPIYKLVKEQWGEERADMLFYHNQKKMLHGEDISIGEPRLVDSMEKTSLMSRISGFFKSLG